MDRVIRIIVDSSGARSGSLEVRNALNQIERSAHGADDSLKDLALSAAKFAGEMLTIGAAANAWIKYDAATQNAANLTGAALADIKAAALSSGVAMGRFAADVAQAFGVIGSEMPSLLEMPAALKAVTDQSLELADAAKATGDAMTDADAAAAITAGLNQWAVAAKDAAKEADRFGNVLAAGAQLGSSSITQVVEAMRVSGAVASAASVGFEEYNAALQVMAQRQLKGSEAGTALRNILLAIQTNGDRLKDFGISGLDATLKTEGLSAALGRLAPIMNNTAALAKVFNAENVASAQILIQGAQSIETLTGKLTGTTTAADQAAAGMQSFSRQTEISISMLQNIAAFSIDNVLGPALTPALIEVNKLLKEIFESLQTFSESEDFAALGDEVDIWRENFESLLPALDLIASGFVQIVDVVNEIPTGLDSVGVSLDWFGGNTTLLDLFKDAYDEIMHLNTALEVFVAMAAAEFGRVKDTFIDIWVAGKEAAIDAFGRIANAIASVRLILADAQAAVGRFLRDTIDVVASVYNKLAMLGGPMSALAGEINQARDAVGGFAIDGVMAGNALREELKTRTAVIQDQIANYHQLGIEQEKATAESYAQATALVEESVARHEAAKGATAQAREKAAYSRETDKAIAAIEKENAELMNAGTATKSAGAGMASLAGETAKASGKLSEAEKAAKRAADEVENLWERIADESATLGMDEIEKKAWSLAEAMRAVGADEGLIKTKTEEYETQLRLNEEFENAVEMNEKMAQAADQRAASQRASLDELKEEIGYMKIVNSEERARAKFLDGYDEKHRAAAAALYDQQTALEGQQAALAENKRMWDEIGQKAEEFFTDLLVNGKADFKSLADYAKKVLIKMFIDSATAGRGIFGQLAGVFGGLGAAGTASASGGGGGGGLGMLGGLLQYGASLATGAGFTGLGSLLGGAGVGSQLGLFGGGLSYGASAIGAGSTMAGVGSILGAAAPWLAGGMALFSLLGDKFKGETRGGGAYSLSGEGAFDRMRGPSGGDIGGSEGRSAVQTGMQAASNTLNGLLAMLGSSARVNTYSGILETSGKGRGGVGAGGTLSTGQSFGEVQTPGGQNVWDPRVSRTLTGEEAGEAFGLQLGQSVLEGIKAAPDTPEWAQAMLDIDIGLLNEEQVNSLTANLQGMAQASATFKAMGGDFGQLAKDLKPEEIISGVQALAGINPVLGALRISALGVDTAGVQAADGLAELFGGLEQFGQATSAYYQEFFSETEREAYRLESATSRLNSGFKDLGMEVPKTREEFRALVSSLDLSTESGRQLFKALMDLAGAADVAYDAVEAAAERADDTTENAEEQTTAMDSLTDAQEAYMNQVHQIPPAMSEAGDAISDFANRAMQAAQSLWDWLDRQALGDTSSLNPMEQLAEAERQAMSLYNAAMAGDVEAAGRLPQALDTLLAHRRAVYGSQGYAEYEAAIRSGAARVAGRMEGTQPQASAPVNGQAPAQSPQLPAPQQPQGGGGFGVTESLMRTLFSQLVDAIKTGDAEQERLLKSIIQRFDAASEYVARNIRLTAGAGESW